jgi:hypothetical protein
MKNKITEILQHKVSWHTNPNSNELDEDTILHIEQDIISGCNQGEIVTEKGTGWWHIINWEDIALQLYNALKDNNIMTNNQMIALERFDKEWTYGK